MNDKMTGSDYKKPKPSAGSTLDNFTPITLEYSGTISPKDTVKVQKKKKGKTDSFDKQMKRANTIAFLQDILENVGHGLMKILCPILSPVCKVAAFLARVVGMISSLLILPGIWYAFRCYGAFKAGQGLFYGGYFQIAATFIIFPFAAMFVHVILRMLADFFSDHIF